MGSRTRIGVHVGNRLRWVDFSAELWVGRHTSSFTGGIVIEHWVSAHSAIWWDYGEMEHGGRGRQGRVSSNVVSNVAHVCVLISIISSFRGRLYT